MKPEIKKLWVEALRSGRYQQTKDVLHNRQDNSFCCLGVLCDLALNAGAVEKKVDHVLTSEEHCALEGLPVFAYDGACQVLPKSVTEWAGLDSAAPEVTIFEESWVPEDPLCDEVPADQPLTDMNDDGMTFPQIADMIEEFL